ncbi:MAG TPA: efflux RND transporter permease subunit, partial [Plasticicumulans sp.]|nr:efflux RND transporter permease subunit [Plasticicumulans sp.]
MLRRRFFRNPVFANLALLLALLAGVLSWWQMPREQTARPSAAAVEIVTAAPGLATAEIETRVTAVLEAAIKPIADLDFIASTSRVGESRLTVRLRTVSEATFERRLNELRWIVQHVERQLPSLAGRPEIASVHGAGVLPSADVLVLARAPDA